MDFSKTVLYLMWDMVYTCRHTHIFSLFSCFKYFTEFNESTQTSGRSDNKGYCDNSKDSQRNEEQLGDKGTQGYYNIDLSGQPKGANTADGCASYKDL